VVKEAMNFTPTIKKDLECTETYKEIQQILVNEIFMAENLSLNT